MQCPDPALPCAREPRVAAPTGRPPTHRAASTAANIRPPVLGPAVPPVGRLDGCHLRRPTRHGDPWQRTAFKLVWAWKSRRNGPGRPAVAPEVRALIRHISRANPLWGAPRIHGELQKLGIVISQASRKPWRCHARTVAGCTMTRLDRQPVQILVSQTQRIRSHRARCGGGRTAGGPGVDGAAPRSPGRPPPTRRVQRDRTSINCSRVIMGHPGLRHGV
jgi:hypothetical protein